MKNSSLKFKLMLSFVVSGFLPLIGIGFYTFYSNLSLKEDFKNELKSELRMHNALQENKINNYFDNLNNNIKELSEDKKIINALKQFISAVDQESISDLEYNLSLEKLKNYYQNQVTFNEDFIMKSNFDSQKYLDLLPPISVYYQNKFLVEKNFDPSNREGKNNLSINKYPIVHEKYNYIFKKIVKKFKMKDLLLINSINGQIVYSVNKSIDFLTYFENNLLTDDKIKKSLSYGFKKNEANQSRMVDFLNYLPYQQSKTSFLIMPIFDNDYKIGSLVFVLDDSFVKDLNSSGKDSRVLSFVYGESTKDEFLKNFDVNILKIEKELNILETKWNLVSIESYNTFNTKIDENNLYLFLQLITFCIFILVFGRLTAGKLSNKISSFAVDLIESAKAVSLESGDIAETSNRLSKASTESAASLEETVASIDEINSMIQRNAHSAMESTKVSKQSSDVAVKGRSTVDSMIAAINEIFESNEKIAIEMEKSNDEISQIVEVISRIGEKTNIINDIVLQTKLLSFNASVEAARAGEHGKGFSVVAEEVGNLASMSGKAASEITQMLDESTKQVERIVEVTRERVDSLVNSSKIKIEQGTRTASDCGLALDEILKNVNSVNELVQEIASASKEQSIGVHEVSKALQQLDQITHKNTAVAQETSTMATRMKKESNNLYLVVQKLTDFTDGTDKLNSFNSLDYFIETSDKDKEDLIKIKTESKNNNVLVLNRKNKNNSEEVKVNLDKNNQDNSKSVVNGVEVPDETDSRFFEDL